MQRTSREGLVVTDGKLELITLSPSAMNTFEDCPAGYLYKYLRNVLPKIETDESIETGHVGRKVHSAAEHDYDAKEMENILAFEKDSVKKQVREMKNLGETRDYLELPSVTEAFLQVPVKDKGYLRGFPDRITREGDDYEVIDKKTTGNPSPYSDRRQTLAYVYMLVTLSSMLEEAISEQNPDEDIDYRTAALKVGKSMGLGEKDSLKFTKVAELTGCKAVDPEKVTMSIDYLRVDYQKTFELQKGELALYENYLVSMFGRVRKTVEAWLRHGDMNRIEHHPGNCLFCPVMGSCKAYQVVVNAHYDPVNPEEVSTEELIKEFIDRKEVENVNDIRLKALKKAILLRHKQGDEKIDSFLRVRSKEQVKYPAKDLIRRVLPLALKKPAKNIQFQSMIDWNLVYDTVADLVDSVLTTGLVTKNRVPDQYLEELEDIKQVSHTRPSVTIKS